jgi:hypothetical protein
MSGVWRVTSREHHGSAALRQLTLLSIAALVAAAGVAVLIARSPDQGVDLASIRQGVAYGLVFAAAPIGVLLAHDGTLAAGLGAGMTAAGTVTVWDGNFPAVLMVVCGAPLAWLGWNASEAPRPDVVRQFVISSVALVAATYLVLETVGYRQHRRCAGRFHLVVSAVGISETVTSSPGVTTSRQEQAQTIAAGDSQATTTGAIVATYAPAEGLAAGTGMT